jgi:hypothetical protein
MKILAYCPLAPKTPKIYGRSLTSIFRLEWDRPLPMVFGREDNPRTTHYWNLADKHNEARRMALEGGFDALFFVESDMILPPHALRKLAKLDTDVAYGLYCNRHGWRQWLAFTYIDRTGSVSLSRDKEKARAYWGKPIDTMGAGMGCTLIHRRVLEEIEFRVPPKGDVADDWLFSLGCIEKGFRQTHHLGVVCGHISPRGILWPDPGAEGLVRLEFEDAAVPTARSERGKPVQASVNSFGLTEFYGQIEPAGGRDGL